MWTVPCAGAGTAVPLHIHAKYRQTGTRAASDTVPSLHPSSKRKKNNEKEKEKEHRSGSLTLTPSLLPPP